MSEAINVEVPTVGESISEVQIGQWLKQEGEWVSEGEDLVEIETEKASVQVPAPSSGILQGILKSSEEFATVGEVIASIVPSDQPAPSDPSPAPTPAAPTATSTATEPAAGESGAPKFVMPAAQRLIDENGLIASEIPATGPGGRLLKEDVQAFLDREQPASSPTTPAATPAKPPTPAPQSPL